MRLFIKESKKEKKDFKKFVSRHSSAYVDWELLYRMDKCQINEIPLDEFLELIARDDLWYNTFLNNIKIRLTK